MDGRRGATGRVLGVVVAVSLAAGVVTAVLRDPDETQLTVAGPRSASAESADTTTSAPPPPSTTEVTPLAGDTAPTSPLAPPTTRAAAPKRTTAPRPTTTTAPTIPVTPHQYVRRELPHGGAFEARALPFMSTGKIGAATMGYGYQHHWHIHRLEWPSAAIEFSFAPTAESWLGDAWIDDAGILQTSVTSIPYIAGPPTPLGPNQIPFNSYGGVHVEVEPALLRINGGQLPYGWEWDFSACPCEGAGPFVVGAHEPATGRHWTITVGRNAYGEVWAIATEP